MSEISKIDSLIEKLFLGNQEACTQLKNICKETQSCEYIFKKLYNDSNGNKYSQYLLGHMFLCGYGTNKSYQEGFKFIKLSAAQGYALAETYMGYFYLGGLVVEQNYVNALIWFKLAAEQNEPNAQYYIGMMYFKGFGLEKDCQEALKWLKLSAEQGHDKAKITINLVKYYLANH